MSANSSPTRFLSAIPANILTLTFQVPSDTNRKGFWECSTHRPAYLGIHLLTMLLTVIRHHQFLPLSAAAISLGLAKSLYARKSPFDGTRWLDALESI